MAEYCAPPLWHASGYLLGSIDPPELGFSKRLQKDLAIWIDRFTRRLIWDNPSESPGWSSDGNRARFLRQRDELAHHLQKELPGIKIIVADVDY